MINKVFVLILGSVIVTSLAWADRIIVSPITPPYDIYHPQDRGQIYSSYRMLVEKRDGVTSLEARLITQYEAVMHDLDFGYEVAKPKVIAETPQEWRVRIPSKFSISQNKRPPDFVVCVDKKNGKVTCFAPEAVREKISLPHSFKGWELYSWTKDHEWYFSLLEGTNRLKTYEEITANDGVLKGVDALKARLAQLFKNENVSWASFMVPGFALPSRRTIADIEKYCDSLGIELVKLNIK